MRQGQTDSVTVGVDLGATRVRAAVVNHEGRSLALHHHPTDPEMGSDHIIDEIVECVGGCIRGVGQQVSALGVGVAGQVDHFGVVRSSPNLKWHNVPLKEMLEDRLQMPVVVVNDVRAAAFGEWQFGSGRQESDLVVLFVGTGIGGGIITGGNLLSGCTNTGGELGHMTIVVGGRRCHCPNAGCLEAYAGGWAIAERAQAAVREDPCAGRLLLSLAAEEDITAITVRDAFRQGDPMAGRLVEETAGYLAAGAVGIVNIVNPRLLVLGGGVIEGLPEIVGMVEESVRAHALEPGVQTLSMVKAALGERAGIIGAGALARVGTWK